MKGIFTCLHNSPQISNLREKNLSSLDLKISNALFTNEKSEILIMIIICGIALWSKAQIKYKIYTHKKYIILVKSRTTNTQKRLLESSF